MYRWDMNYRKVCSRNVAKHTLKLRSTIALYVLLCENILLKLAFKSFKLNSMIFNQSMMLTTDTRSLVYCCVHTHECCCCCWAFQRPLLPSDHSQVSHTQSVRAGSMNSTPAQALSPLSHPQDTARKSPLLPNQVARKFLLLLLFYLCNIDAAYVAAR